MAKWTFTKVVKRLRGSEANISCKEMRSLLEGLGFTVKCGNNGRHHTFSHPKIKSFYGGHYNCGHEAHMLPVYPKNVLRILYDLQVELEELEK